MCESKWIECQPNLKVVIIRKDVGIPAESVSITDHLEPDSCLAPIWAPLNDYIHSKMELLPQNTKKMRKPTKSWNFSYPDSWRVPGNSLCPCRPALVNLPALYKAPPHPLLLWCCWQLGPWKLEILKRRLFEEIHIFGWKSLHTKKPGKSIIDLSTRPQNQKKKNK